MSQPSKSSKSKWWRSCKTSCYPFPVEYWEIKAAAKLFISLKSQSSFLSSCVDHRSEEVLKWYLSSIPWCFSTRVNHSTQHAISLTATYHLTPAFYRGKRKVQVRVHQSPVGTLTSVKDKGHLCSQSWTYCGQWPEVQILWPATRTSNKTVSDQSLKYHSHWPNV